MQGGGVPIGSPPTNWSLGATDSFDLGSDLLCVVDAKGYILTLNTAWEEVLGWSRQEIQSRPFFELIHPADVAATRKAAAAVNEPAATVSAFDNRCRAKDGSYRWLRWNARSDGGQWFAVAFDVTAEVEREEELRSILHEDHLVAYSQPIVDRRRMQVSHEELLVRARIGPHGDEVLSPASFLPDAERLGLVALVDRWMMEQAVRLAAARAVAVNVSAKSIDDPTVREELCQIVESAPPRPGRLILEFTETAAFDNLHGALELIERLEPLGCQFALDDFGTGFASLSYLRALPVHYLKIDRSFVSGVARSPEDQSLVRSLIAIAAELGLWTVAEGVEDGQTLELLRDYGADFFQGYLLGAPEPVWKPAPAEAKAWASPRTSWALVDGYRLPVDA